MAGVCSLLEQYKAWVRAHPNVISSLDWLLYLGVWSPGRLSGSEATYETYHAVVGLLDVWHRRILEEAADKVQRPVSHLWLDMLEQVETLVEVRAMHLESMGAMSRYGPLVVVESIKSLLKMALWTQHPGHLFLRTPAASDVQHWEAERGLQDLLDAFQRLRARHTSPVAPALQGPRASLRGAVSWAKRLLSFQDTRPGGLPDATGSGAGCSSSSSGSAPKVVRHPNGSASPGWPRPLIPIDRTVPASLQGRTDYAHGVPIGIAHPGAAAHVGGAAVIAADGVERAVGSNLVWLAELLYIWRPVVYVALLKRCGRGSWRPWLTSLALDLASQHYQRRGKGQMRQGGATARQAPCGTSLLSLALLRSLGGQAWSAGEDREMADRYNKLALYLLRGPALDLVVKAPLEGMRRRMANVPVAGFVTDYVAGLVNTYTDYYTYTAGSA